MADDAELTAQQLYRKCDLEGVEFETTDDLESLEGMLGQPRAVQAVEFGIGIDRDGYNIFAFGPDGTGKHSAVRQMLQRRAARLPAPPDLCYVHNFSDSRCPRLLSLPPGKGHLLCKSMAHLRDELASTLRVALDSDAYQARRQALEEQFEDRQSQALSELGERAQEKGLALVRTPVGMVFAPRDGDDDVLSAEQFQALPEKQRQQLQQEIDRFKDELHKLMRSVPRWKRETRDRIRELHREVSRFAVGPLMEEIRERFSEVAEVGEYLEQVEADIVANAHRLAGMEREQTAEALAAQLAEGDSEPAPIKRYDVNLLVDHAESEGVPVVYEDNPTYQNLVGRVEHIPKMGTMVTDFTLIKPGALHRANGGYLLIDALKLLRHPYAWEGLKRTLRSRRIKIEALAEALSLISTYSLQPEPAELSIKIVLFGTSRLYYLLSLADPDFEELFKVGADFAEQLDWSAENTPQYARLVAKLVREKGLRPFERSAVARVIEQGARSLGDQHKMSLYMGKVLDLMREADHCADRAGRERVSAAEVQQAIDERVFRSDRIRRRIQEQIERGTVLIDTSGEAVGQINGLAVLQLNDFSFGRPSRITARVSLGKGTVVNIEREVELSGPLHSKGVLILSGYLAARYASERPLSLAATLVFEQSYGGVDGDSASSAELYALLSAIARLPIRQSLAVTGSVNQNGQVQAIGGVNQKIEGFFDTCSARGLTGDQGVLIPQSNVEHLMLRADVVEAVESGDFHIYPVSTIDQGIELLTGIESGAADEEGVFPEETVNRRVADRLAELAEAARRHGPAAARGETEQ